MTGRRISRRRMLQNIGVASAVAWTAPIVTSIGSKAFASASDACHEARDWNCGDTFRICGTGGYNGLCLCDVDSSGKSVCWGNYLCGDPNATPCTSNADCNSAFPYCVTSCCGQTCAPNCTNAAPRRAPNGAKTAAGV